MHPLPPLCNALNASVNCSSCPGEMENVSEVGRRCAAAAGARIVARCCVTGTDTIIGLDFHNCSITHLDPTLHLPFSLVAIDLSQNPLQDLPPEMFQGLTSLEYIALPPNISCPGGDGAWRSVNHSAGVCPGPEGWVQQHWRRGAAVSGELAVCSRRPGLLAGSFPMVMFFGILSSVTVTLCVLLWCTQRKKVKSQ
ncbi:unnamed protein product [Ranitomeya imitator]|uniref:Uncharacterized protein n=1 Tax=Ranitomeya imitator TaxID=111125 RepID=A0ABN9LAN4_9NEOB|nr:unnamed protein product [Ranitomeya imitator]